MFAMGTDSGVHTIQFAGPTHSQLRNAAARPFQIRVGCCFSLLSSGNSWTRLSASEFGLDSGAPIPLPRKKGNRPGNFAIFFNKIFRKHAVSLLASPLVSSRGRENRCSGEGNTRELLQNLAMASKEGSKEDQLAAAVAFPHEWFRAWPPAPQNPELEQLTWNEFRHTRTHTRNQN